MLNRGRSVRPQTEPEWVSHVTVYDIEHRTSQ